MPAFSSRFHTARSEPLWYAGDGRRLEVGGELHVREAAACALDRILDQLVHLDGTALLVRVATRQLEEAGDQVAHLVRLALEVGEQLVALAGLQPLLLLQHFDVRLEARERRAQLVRRVGDEAALRLDRLLERREHRVERRAEAGELVPPTRIGNALARIAGARDSLRGSREPPNGTRAARDTSAPAAAPAATPPATISSRIRRSRLSVRSMSSTGRTN